MADMARKGSSCYMLIQQIVEEIFTAESRRLRNLIDDIIRQNNELQSQPSGTALMYAGETYLPSGSNTARGVGTRHIPKASIHPDLESKMAFHVQSSENIANDKRVIGMLLYRLIDPCETEQDIRDALPDEVTDILPNISKFTRTREVGYHLGENDKIGFDEILTKIKFYFAARILY